MNVNFYKMADFLGTEHTDIFLVPVQIFKTINERLR